MPNDLLTLPFAIQVAIGSGYLGYLLAFSGLRGHHTTTDIILRVFALGSITTVIFQVLPSRPLLAGGASLLATLIFALFWRKLGSRWSKWLFRKIQVSWSDDIPTAWLSITAERTDLRPSQLVVELKNGRLLLCEDTRLFAEAPFGPCLFGPEGGLAMYVTAEMDPDGKWIEHEYILHPREGAKITHVPASEIARTEIRFWQHPTGSGEAAETVQVTAEVQDVAAEPSASLSPECKSA